MHPNIIIEFNTFTILIVYFSSINCLHSISKRHYQIPAYDQKNIPQQERSIRDSILDRFHINTNTIIRTHDSRALGAKYLNETELASNEDCLYWCWETSPCNLAVYEEKTRGSCYLFDCGSNQDFKCKFTPHNFYSSSILQINRHPYDLSQWGVQVQHEKELTKLRSKSAYIEGTVAPLPRSSTSSLRNLIAPSPVPTTTINALIFQKSSRCLHYQFECRNSSECIAIYNVCDGISQCNDGSDEALDLECHKSRYNVPNQPQTHPNSQSVNSGKILSNEQSEAKANEVKSQPSISIYQHQSHESRIPTNKGSQSLPVYNYPKTADSETLRSTDDQSVVPKKHNYSPSGERSVKNNYNTPYRGSWNQYYPPNDVYNGGDNRISNNGYLVEPEYINGYGSNRESSANPGSYWPSIGRQQSYDLSDQLIPPASQSYLPLPKSQQNNGDEWQQSNDRDSNYYDHISRTGINRPETIARPVSQETSSDTKAYMKGHQTQTQSALKLKPGSGNKKYEQQLKSQSKEKDESNKALIHSKPTSGYSHLASNKGYVNSPNIVAVSYMHDSNQQSGRETNSAVIALSLGLLVTALLVVLVGCRMKSFKRKIARRGRTLAHDADYLVNGMYL